MFNKKILLFLVILLIFCSINSIVAYEDNTTDIIADNTNVNDSIGLSDKSLSDLDKSIQEADGYLNLKDYYNYNPDTDSKYTLDDLPYGDSVTVDDMKKLLKLKNTGINITHDIVIDGTYNQLSFDDKIFNIPITINCKNQCHLFNIYNSHVVLKNIIFTNSNYYLNTSYSFGYDFYGFGGVIYAENSTLEIINCTFKNSIARQGGAIYGVNTVLTIFNSKFNNCSSLYTDGGGAISSTSGETNITYSTFKDNYAYGEGGALYLSSANIISSVFINNTCTSNGGAAYLSQCNISYSNFTNNRGKMGSALYSLGGEIINSIFNGNNASQYGAFYGCGVVYNSIFQNNTAGKYGGGAYFIKSSEDNFISNCTFRNNSAVNGGGVYNSNSVLAITQSFFNENTATTGAGIYLINGNGILTNTVFKYNNASNTADDVYWNADTGYILDCVSYSHINITDDNLVVLVEYDPLTNLDDFIIIVDEIIGDDDVSNTLVDNSSIVNSVTTKTSFKKITPVISAKKVSFKVKKKTKKYSVILKASGKRLSKICLYLKVKGKTYNSKTNKYGKAVFKIKNLKKKGTYKACIIFKGSKCYNRVSRFVKIVVRK